MRLALFLFSDFGLFVFCFWKLANTPHQSITVVKGWEMNDWIFAWTCHIFSETRLSSARADTIPEMQLINTGFKRWHNGPIACQLKNCVLLEYIRSFMIKEKLSKVSEKWLKAIIFNRNHMNFGMPKCYKKFTVNNIFNMCFTSQYLLTLETILRDSNKLNIVTFYWKIFKPNLTFNASEWLHNICTSIFEKVTILRNQQ